MLKIDPFLFEKYYQLFLYLVENNSNTKFISFPGNRYTDEQEGYKDKIYAIAREKLGCWEWRKKDIGSGKIFQSTIYSLRLDKKKNNLVDWRIISTFENKPNKNNLLMAYEKALFEFYQDLESDKESFNVFIQHFGKNYPLIAYLFFIKDKALYSPISPTNFDIAFEKLGVQNFKTSHQCSWDNYCQYNNLLKQIREFLILKGIKDITLLNAHSFAWMISDIEEELSKIGRSDPDITRQINAHKQLAQKDKETVIKARIGQGLFRSSLLDYWRKGSVTGCDKIDVLIASHIKPWKDCDNGDAIDLFNGLLLTPNLDKLFDSGLITFDDNGNILISSELTEKNLHSFGVNNKMKLNKMEENHEKYLGYHRKMVFKK